MQTKLLSYDAAKRCVQNLGVKTARAYSAIPATRRQELGLPSNPYTYYNRPGVEFSWSDFLGKPVKHFVTQDELAQIARMQRLFCASHYISFARANPSFGLPIRPDMYYGSAWQGFAKVLPSRWLTYVELQELVRRIGVTSRRDFISRHSRGELPRNAPSRPELVYADWTSWPAFLGKHK